MDRQKVKELLLTEYLDVDKWKMYKKSDDISGYSFMSKVFNNNEYFMIGGMGASLYRGDEIIHIFYYGFFFCKIKKLYKKLIKRESRNSRK